MLSVTVESTDVINVEAYEVAMKDFCYTLSSKKVGYLLYFDICLRWKWKYGKNIKMEICFSMLFLALQMKKCKNNTKLCLEKSLQIKKN